MFDLLVLLLLVAGSLMAGDIMLMASRSLTKAKPAWKLTIASGAAGMLAAELSTFLSWQFARPLSASIGDGPATWVAVAASGVAGSLVSGFVLSRQRVMTYRRAVAVAALGIVPAFALYSLLLGIFESLMA